MTDYYSILGLARGASPDEIKRAYRKYASLYHPDKEGGSKAKFQELQQAYETLSDPNKRQQYDQPQPQGFHFEFGRGGDGGGFDFNNIFSMFGQHFHNGQPRPNGHQHRQQHTRMSLWVTLQDVAEGGTRPVTVGTQHGTMTIEIEIPLGINDGDHVQYGAIGPGGTDLIINFRIHPNPKWQRTGLNLTTDHHVSIWDCLAGGEVEIRDILNATISLSVPALTQPNAMLRLKGRGLRSRSGEVGDLLVRLVARVPASIDNELLELIKQAQKKLP
jgi:curved DNA-binding protein